jgi:hypothetical protein
MGLRLTVDDEQNTSDQRANSCDDVKYCTESYAKKGQSGDYQKNSEHDPFQSIHNFSPFFNKRFAEMKDL